MVGARLQFPAAGGVTAPRRPSSPTAADGAGFAGMVDDAVGASSAARRDDPVRPTQAARPRRAEAVEPRATEPQAAEASPRTASAAGEPAADRADDAVRDEKSTQTGECSGEAPALEVATPQAEAAPVKTDAAAGDAAAPQHAATEGVTSEVAQDAVAAAVVAAAADAPVELSAGESSAAEGEAGNAGPSTATLPEAPAADEETSEAKQADAGIRGRTPAASTGLPDRIGANRTAGARAETPEAAGEPVIELAPQAVEGGHQDAAAPPTGTRPANPVPDTGASSSPPAGKTDAAATLVEAVSEVETLTDTDSSGGAELADAGTQDQPQPRQAPSTSGQAAQAVAAAPGAPEGVRFTVNVATGSAAYASAAPRQEEAVLPQIVQSIRLQTAQGSSEARVQLRPEHLGVLNITLKVDHGQVTATIQASVAAVRQWIESHESSLRQALSEQGLELTRLVVQPDEEQGNEEGREQGETRRQPQRRSWRDEDVTFEVLV